MREKTVDVLDSLSWTIQPKLWLMKGDYYREEGYFDPHPGPDSGAHFYGVLEVVSESGALRLVEFNEFNADTYYIRRYRGVNKRYSGYGFLQATRERTAETHVVLVNGMTFVEEQMLRENRLDGHFDLLTGASNSIRQGMLVMADKIARRLDAPSGKRYYGLAQAVEPGVTGRLQVVVEEGKIVSFFYDEIFADTPEEIADEELRPYYRQSKYYSLDYVADYPFGFYALFDRLRDQVLARQDLLDLSNLPFSEGVFYDRAWKSYLSLARPLWEELQKDGVLGRQP